MVTVLILGLTLRDAVGEPDMELDVTGDTTVKQLLDANQDRLSELIAFIDKGEVLVTVNKKIGALTSVVKNGDTVKFSHQSNPSSDGARWHNP